MAGGDDFTPQADRRLDLRHLKCPLPVLRTRKALRTMAPGAVLYVEATDGMTPIDLPNCCREDGHRLLASDRRGDIYRFLIQRGTKAAGDGQG